MGLVSEDRIAVSSAKVAIKVSSDVGISAVKVRYSKGPRTLPCGTPAQVKFADLNGVFIICLLDPTFFYLDFLKFG